MMRKTTALLVALIMALACGCSDISGSLPTASGSQTAQASQQSSQQSGSSSSAAKQTAATGRVITTAQELLDLSRMVSSGDKSYLNYRWELGADIDLTGIEWEPIGRLVYNDERSFDDYAGDASFCGVFDGKGYTVSNMSLEGKEIYGTGFFGLIGPGAVITDLHVEGSVTGERGVGGLVGMAYRQEGAAAASVSRCSFKGVVNGLSVEVGGLIGSAGGASIELCFADAVVTGMYDVGGFAGAVTTGTVIRDCGCTGRVIARSVFKNEEAFGRSAAEDWESLKTQQETYVRHIGGFAGGDYAASISTSYSNSRVMCYDIAALVGGFIGYFVDGDGGSVQDCYANSEINSWYTKDLNKYVYSLSTADMGVQECFKFWDFTNRWSISEEYNSPVPIY